MKKLAVSVGIPAYNEEANIKNLLDMIMRQKQQSFELKEVLVVSDCSSDKTDEIVKNLSKEHAVIKLFRLEKRSGQALAQNTILEVFKGDVLVLLNADVAIPEEYIEAIVQPFISESEQNIGIVGAKVEPFPAETLFGKIINYSHAVKTNLYESWNNKRNIYLCHGRGRAFSKAFAKTFRWPELTTEDACSYLACVTNGFLFVYQPEAVVYFQSPQTWADHKKQSMRFMGGRNELYTFYKKEKVDREYDIPLLIKIRQSLQSAFTNPVFFAAYIGILGYIWILSRNYMLQSAVWDTSASSKSIKTNI